MGIWLELVGWSGTAAFVVAYYLVSVGKLKPDGALYQWLNLGGAVAVGFSVFPRQAWPAFWLEVIWGGIALTALLRLWRDGAAGGQ
ncbi:MAG: hypothetical protein HGA80_02000 [Candidatus Omnitrophica bacterium]|nr:hypothetical protein [Candidatus Omnitrophota bacterium]